MGLVKYSFISIIFFCMSCGYINKYVKSTKKHYNNYYQCLRKTQLNKYKTNTNYGYIYNDFKNTLNQWIKTEEYYFKNYPNYYDFKIDSCIFISSDTSNALILITLIDKSFRIPEFGGHSKLIFAQRLNNKWLYHHQSLPFIGFGLDTARARQKILYTHSEIAQQTINLLMQDGLIKFRKPCIADDTYIKTRHDEQLTK